MNCEECEGGCPCEERGYQEGWDEGMQEAEDSQERPKDVLEEAGNAVEKKIMDFLHFEITDPKTASLIRSFYHRDIKPIFK